MKEGPIQRALNAMRRRQGPSYGDVVASVKRRQAQAYVTANPLAHVTASREREVVDAMGEEFYLWLVTDDAPTPAAITAPEVEEDPERDSDDITIELTYDPETDDVFVWEPHGRGADLLNDHDIHRILRLAVDAYEPPDADEETL